MPKPRKYVNKGKKCYINGCDRPAYRRGWCRRHYERWKKWGHPQAYVRPGRIPKGRSMKVIYIRENI